MYCLDNYNTLPLFEEDRFIVDVTVVFEGIGIVFEVVVDGLGGKTGLLT
jgi:hypothetical protein